VNIVLPNLIERHSPNYSSRHGSTPRLLVWHETAGAYDGAVSWLCNPAAQASAHIVLREDANEATQLVALHDKAWHAAAFNSASVGVEHANTTAKGYASEHQLEVSARIFGWLCLRLHIPPRWSRHGVEPGICRHLDLGALGGGHFSCGTGDHDWQRFLAMVHAELARGGFRDHWAS
jgi:N-acetyl-anhydromuramyl-L-alanine amidase AmpD